MDCGCAAVVADETVPELTVDADGVCALDEVAESVGC